MARILLGVSGGISAYKALELARLATKGARRPGPDDARGAALRRRGLLRGHHRRAGAHRRVRARPDARRLPRRPAARPRSDRPPRVVANADAYLSRPASANTIAKLAAGIADSMLTTSFLACTAPRAGRPRDERPDVPRRRPPRRTWRRCAGAASR